jgi:copper chaperone CopZ
MKQFAKFLTAVMLAAGLLAISGCEKSEQPAAQAEQNQTVQAQHVKLAVDGMTCGSCAKSIEMALAKKSGVIKGQVSLDENACDVEYDASKTNADEIVATIEKAGYKAKVVQ